VRMPVAWKQKNRKQSSNDLPPARGRTNSWHGLAAAGGAQDICRLGALLLVLEQTGACCDAGPESFDLKLGISFSA